MVEKPECTATAKSQCSKNPSCCRGGYPTQGHPKRGTDIPGSRRPQEKAFLGPRAAQDRLGQVQGYDDSGLGVLDGPGARRDEDDRDDGAQPLHQCCTEMVNVRKPQQIR